MNGVTIHVAKPCRALGGIDGSTCATNLGPAAADAAVKARIARQLPGAHTRKYEKGANRIGASRLKRGSSAGHIFL
jgi:hypothetical protein